MRQHFVNPLYLTGNALLQHPSIRLFVEAPLAKGAVVTLEDKQAHYLASVMRQKLGDVVALFNGRDGEWAAEIADIGKKNARLACREKLRAFSPAPDVWLCFAPLKHGPIDYLAQKATELGVGKLVPVLTERTVATRVNVERLRANAVEAAEQSERLDVPPVEMPVKLPYLLGNWPKDRLLLFCDESGGGQPLNEVLVSLEKHTPLAVLIGPEGGFSPQEQRMIHDIPQARAAGLGPRVLRADTAAIAALACVQCLRGEWAEAPAFRGEGRQ